MYCDVHIKKLVIVLFKIVVKTIMKAINSDIDETSDISKGVGSCNVYAYWQSGTKQENTWYLDVAHQGITPSTKNNFLLRQA